MLVIKKFIPIYIFFIFVSSVASSEELRNLEGVAEVIKAKTAYQKLLIEARLVESQVELNYAKAALNWAKVRHLELYMKALHHEFERVKREEKTNESRINEVRTQAELCSGLVDGDTSQGAFRGLRYFRRYFVPIGLTKKAMFAKVEPLAASNFIPNYAGMESLAFNGGNLGELIQFMETNNYSFTPWKKAHGLILDYVGLIIASAEKKINEYRRYMDGIRAGTLNIWELPNG